MRKLLTLTFRAAMAPLLVSFATTTIFAAAASRAPATSRQPVPRTYHGERIADNYAWLENATDSRVKAWTATQNDHARRYLDARPERQEIEYQLSRLVSGSSPDYSALTWKGGRLFLLKFEPPAQQAVLVMLESPGDLKSEKVIVDPNQLASGTSIDWFAPSHDGKLIAVSLSEQGSEKGTLYFYESETGQRLDDRIPGVQFPTAGGSAAWNHDNSGVFYTRYPKAGERPGEDLYFFQQVYFHKLGTDAGEDRYELGKGLPRIALIELESNPDGSYLLATVANGDGGDYAHYLRNPRGEWKQVTRFEDQVKHAEFGQQPLYIEAGRDDALYLLSRQGAPRGKIIRVPLATPTLANARTIVPEGTNVLHLFKPTASGIAVAWLRGGVSEFTFHDFADPSFRGPRRTAGPNFTQPVSIRQMVLRRGDEIMFRSESFTEPFTWWSYDLNRDRERIEATALRGKSPVPFSDVEAVRVNVTSKDGTRIPMTIVQRKGTRRNGNNPTILTGYGGFGISVTPRFDVTRKVWLDQGGVFALANLRGGGEYGEEWHKAGNLLKKQNVFDDFAACAEWLVHSNYTRPGKLAVQGGSNGGLLVGALITQRPELVEAAVAHVGLFDMLRFENDPNGVFNSTEYGSVRDPAQFRALRAYSPYHNVKDRTAYPAVLLLTGEHDGRVNPAHSKKMAARLQAATSAERPILLRTSATSGHGIGTALSERIAQWADVYAFLSERLGLQFSLVARGPWSGGVTPHSAVVKAKLAREGLPARLLVGKSPDLSRPLYFATNPSESNRYNIVEFNAAGLEPDTQYYYGIEVNHRLDRREQGQFRTFPKPDQPASFRIAFASCGRTGSTREVFDRIREHQPLFYMNMGDFHYQDIRTNSLALFRTAFDLVLASPQQADLYRSTSFLYIWDDHDFGGNNATRRSTTHAAARGAYDEFVPHYPFVFAEPAAPITQSFAVGRVKFILTDLRSDRDDPRQRDDESKSILGDRQKEWLKRELLAAKGKYPLIFWMSSVPWIGEASQSPYRAVGSNQFGFIHHTNLVETTTRTNRNRGGGDQDHWSVFSHERREIADFIKDNQIKGVAILHGDAHMMAADDGSNSDYATGGGAPIPVMCGGPLDQNPSIKGGPYSQGVYRVRDREGESGFGLLEVTDHGPAIDVRFSGRNNRNEEVISLKFSVSATQGDLTAVKQEEP